MQALRGMTSKKHRGQVFILHSLIKFVKNEDLTLLFSVAIIIKNRRSRKKGVDLEKAGINAATGTRRQVMRGDFILFYFLLICFNVFECLFAINLLASFSAATRGKQKGQVFILDIYICFSN